MTTLQRTLALLALLISGTAGMAADEPVADAPLTDEPAADTPVSDAVAVPPLVQLWETQAILNVERDVVAHIVNDEDVVYVQSNAGIVTALNAETGREMWTAQVGRTDEVAMPASSNASIVMIVAGPALYALDKFSGKELFSYRLPSQPSAGPVITEGSFFIPLADNSLCTCALKTLQYLERYNKLPPGIGQAIAWRFVTGEVIKRAPVAGSSRVGFVTEKGNIFVVDISGGQAGRSKFQFLMQSPPTAPLTLVTRDQEYLLAAAANNRLFCIGMNTNGRMQWTFPLGQRVSEPITVIGQDVYIVGDDGELLGLGLKSGLPLQTAEDTPFALTDVEALVSVTGNAVYVIDSAGRLVTVNRKTGQVVAKEQYRDFTIPIRNSVTDRVYLSSKSGRVVCLKESGIDFPIYHQNPQRSPIMPEVAKPAPPEPAADASAENN
ncbi:MAG: PQQ-binding-like beta-propeller repeat protein [Planctomycetaceae bacterium]